MFLLQTYIMHSVSKRLFQTICTCVADRDSHLNKITRSLSQLQLRELGVRAEFWSVILDVCWSAVVAVVVI